MSTSPVLVFLLVWLMGFTLDVSAGQGSSENQYLMDTRQLDSMAGTTLGQHSERSLDDEQDGFPIHSSGGNSWLRQIEPLSRANLAKILAARGDNDRPLIWMNFIAPRVLGRRVSRRKESARSLEPSLSLRAFDTLSGASLGSQRKRMDSMSGMTFGGPNKRMDSLSGHTLGEEKFERK